MWASFGNPVLAATTPNLLSDVTYIHHLVLRNFVLILINKISEFLTTDQKATKSTFGAACCS